MSKLWQISTTECAGDKEAIMRRGNVYQLANGYMGYRGTLDEFGPDEAGASRWRASLTGSARPGANRSTPPTADSRR